MFYKILKIKSVKPLKISAPWISQKTRDFLMFSGDIIWEHGQKCVKKRRAFYQLNNLIGYFLINFSLFLCYFLLHCCNNFDNRSKCKAFMWLLDQESVAQWNNPIFRKKIRRLKHGTWFTKKYFAGFFNEITFVMIKIWYVNLFKKQVMFKTSWNVLLRKRTQKRHEVFHKLLTPT